jgi:hypothetical protein
MRTSGLERREAFSILVIEMDSHPSLAEQNRDSAVKILVFCPIVKTWIVRIRRHTRKVLEFTNENYLDSFILANQQPRLL